MQLVQNSVIPTLRIEIYQDRLEFCNNEEGFTENNIVALCNIGASTKAAVAGYIGQKGIGFKSVFKVSQRPRVHSRTYHFQFDSEGASADGFAYIIPTPLPPPPGWDSSRGSTIILPFKRESAPADGGGDSDGGDRIFELVRANVYDIESSMLLFLNRLQRIEIHDESQAVSHRRIMHRRDEPGGIVCIEDNAAAECGDSGRTGGAGAERWLVTSRVFRAGIRRNGLAGEEMTRLSVAVPLLPAAALQPGAQPPPLRDVFAFLPLRSYGFRWVLQGDFVLPSSREAVDASHPWNQMLLAVVPDLFVEAAMGLIDLAAAAAAAGAGESGVKDSNSAEDAAGLGGTSTTPMVSAAQGAQGEGGSTAGMAKASSCTGAPLGEKYLLQLLFAMIPLPGQTSELFALAPRAILSRLRDRACIPVGVGGFARPCKAVHRPSPPSHVDGFTARVLLRMGLHFTRAGIAVPPELQRELGVLQLSVLLCDLLKCAASVWSATPPASSFGSSGAGDCHGDAGVDTATNRKGGCASGGGGERGDGAAGHSLSGTGGDGCSGLGDRAAVDGDRGGEGNEELEFDGEWLVHMLAALEQATDCSMHLEALRALPLFPLAGGGGLARMRDGDIFEVDTNGGSSGVEKSLLHMAGLRVLCPVFSAVLADSRLAVVMARRLGLRSLDSEAFVLRHLIPAMASPALPAEALVRMLSVAKRVAAGVPGLLGVRLVSELLRAGVLLVDSRGRSVPAGSPLHFPPEYAPPDAPAICESAILPPPLAGEDMAERWPTVSGEYLATDGDQAGWFALLKGLGVSLFVSIKPAPTYSSPELAALLLPPLEGVVGATGSAEAARLTRVGSIMSKLWERDYRALAADADAANADGSFVALLRRARWVAGTDGELHVPRDLYAPGARAAQEVLGVRAVLCAPGGVEGALAAALEVRAELSLLDLVGLIKAWAAANEAVPIDLMVRVYSFISRSLSEGVGGENRGKEALAALAGVRSVFVPDRHSASAFNTQKLRSLPDGMKAFALRNDSAPVSGQWLRPQDCVWKDASHMLDSLLCWKRAGDAFFYISDAEHLLASTAFGCRALQAYYPSELRQLFCGGGGGSSSSSGLGVAENPQDEQYLNMWRAAAGVQPATRHSAACVLRICIHFTYELEVRHRDWDCGDDANYGSAVPPLLRTLRAQAALLCVPNASGVSFSPLAQLRWIAEPERDQALLEGWFEQGMLEHCVPLHHSGLHGVFDARLAPTIPTDTSAGPGDDGEIVCVGKLNERMEQFYVRVMQLPRLKDVLTRRIVCEAALPENSTPLSEGNGNEGVWELGPADSCALCHVAVRTLQTWLASAVEESTAAVAAVSGGPGTTVVSQRGRLLAQAAAVGRLRLRRVAAVQMCERWVASAGAGAGWAGEGEPAVEFLSRAVASRPVTCGMDLSDADWPLLLSAGESLRACAVVDVAAAFARLCGEVRRSQGRGRDAALCLAQDAMRCIERSVPRYVWRQGDRSLHERTCHYVALATSLLAPQNRT